MAYFSVKAKAYGTFESLPIYFERFCGLRGLYFDVQEVKWPTSMSCASLLRRRLMEFFSCLSRGLVAIERFCSLYNCRVAVLV